MKIISFRPTFKIPRFVSFFGAASCLFIMFLIDPVFSLIAIITIIALYVWLERRGLKSSWGDIRGGLFLVLAERASRIARRFPRHQISWKPDLLLPVDNPEIWAGSLLFIRSITYPSGSIFAFTVTNTEPEKRNLLSLTYCTQSEPMVYLLTQQSLKNQTFYMARILLSRHLRAVHFDRIYYSLR
ncbi:hypothetical protein JW960_24280 [candidate division KSB1 bacterium]|nr:hypothetical protein [candidate division KSB1 bacterium]